MSCKQRTRGACTQKRQMVLLQFFPPRGILANSLPDMAYPSRCELAANSRKRQGWGWAREECLLILLFDFAQPYYCAYYLLQHYLSFVIACWIPSPLHLGHIGVMAVGQRVFQLCRNGKGTLTWLRDPTHFFGKYPQPGQINYQHFSSNREIAEAQLQKLWKGVGAGHGDKQCKSASSWNEHQPQLAFAATKV